MASVSSESNAEGKLVQEGEEFLGGSVSAPGVVMVRPGRPTGALGAQRAFLGGRRGLAGLP